MQTSKYLSNIRYLHVNIISFLAKKKSKFKQTLKL